MNGYFPVQTLVYPGHERTHQGRVATYPFGESGWWQAKEDWGYSLSSSSDMAASRRTRRMMNHDQHSRRQEPESELTIGAIVEDRGLERERNVEVAYVAEPPLAMPRLCCTLPLSQKR
jgi:hypothetical protein